MEQHRLGLATLAHVEEGALAEAFNKELSLLIADVEGRPEKGKPRTITLKISLTPGDLAGTVGIGYDLRTSKPARDLDGSRMRLGAKHTLSFTDREPDPQMDLPIDGVADKAAQTKKEKT